jgi:hypothetical protein
MVAGGLWFMVAREKRAGNLKNGAVGYREELKYKIPFCSFSKSLIFFNHIFNPISVSCFLHNFGIPSFCSEGMHRSVFYLLFHFYFWVPYIFHCMSINSISFCLMNLEVYKGFLQFSLWAYNINYIVILLITFILIR